MVGLLQRKNGEMVKEHDQKVTQLLFCIYFHSGGDEADMVSLVGWRWEVN